VTQPADLLAQLFAAGAVQQPSFDPDSRYYGLSVLDGSTAEGTPVRYVARRFVPDPGGLSVVQTYRVRQGDRIDVVAASLLGRPLAYWQLCDANLAVEPDDVVAQPGRFIVVTLPRGIAGG
jgi:hypothetical protein